MICELDSNLNIVIDKGLFFFKEFTQETHLILSFVWFLPF